MSEHERVAQELEEARRKALTAPEVLALAAQEELCLVRASNETGFKAVFKDRNVFKAKTPGFLSHGGAQHLGPFPTAEEAALAYARHIGSARAAAEATKWASKSLGHGRGRVLPSELTGGAPVLRLVETPIVV